MKKMNKKVLALALIGAVSVGGISVFASGNNNNSNGNMVKMEMKKDGKGNPQKIESNAASVKKAENLNQSEIEKIAIKQVKNGKIESMSQKNKHNRNIYKFRISDGKNIHKVKVDGTTGKVLESECEHDEFDPAGVDVKIKKADAEAIAKKELGNSTLKTKLERKWGKYVYEIKAKDGKSDKEVKIDANTGKVLEKEVENDD